MLGDKIKHFRTALGLTSKALAEQLDITPAYLSMIESNKRRNITTELLQKIADSLNVPIEALIYEEYTYPISSSYDKLDSLREEKRLFFDSYDKLDETDKQIVLNLIERLQKENRD